LGGRRKEIGFTKQIDHKQIGLGGLKTSFLSGDYRCPGESSELQRRISWQIKQKWPCAAEERGSWQIREGALRRVKPLENS
jgi:hypothetical protein